MPASYIRISDAPGLLQHLDQLTGAPSNEIQLPAPPNFTSRFLDFGLVQVPGRIKTLAVVIDTALTSGGAQQATVQLFVARSIYSVAGANPPAPPPNQAGTPFLGGAGASSQFPTTGLNGTQARGTAVNLGASSASLGPATFFFSPIDIPELQWNYPVVGVEITAPATFSGGAVRVFVTPAVV